MLRLSAWCAGLQWPRTANLPQSAVVNQLRGLHAVLPTSRLHAGGSGSLRHVPSPRCCPQRTAQRCCRHFTETSSGKVAQKLPSTASPSGGSEDLPVPPSSPVLPPFRSSLTSSAGRRTIKWLEQEPIPRTNERG